ncbi:MAG: SMC-Scp complex subunit ScpB [Patescibacteria group bacterium]|jgi:segregation and condensation protein B
MKLKAQLESILFMSPDPLSTKKLAVITQHKPEDIEKALDELGKDIAEGERGVLLQRTGKEVQLTSHPDAAKLVEQFIKSEMTGELTRPQLETLTIVAYRGPIGKMELDQIRGVNCALILRNLLIRGLITRGEVAKEIYEYEISMDFLRHLGLSYVRELPNYETLSSHELIEEMLKKQEEREAAQAMDVPQEINGSAAEETAEGALTT